MMIRDTRRQSQRVEGGLVEMARVGPIKEECYLCGEAVLPGADYQVHLTTAHQDVHVVQEEEEEEDVIGEEEEEEEDVIEDPIECFLCGASVLPGQDYKVHLAAAHKMAKVEQMEIYENTASMWLERTRRAELVELEEDKDEDKEKDTEKEARLKKSVLGERKEAGIEKQGSVKNKQQTERKETSCEKFKLDQQCAIAKVKVMLNEAKEKLGEAVRANKFGEAHDLQKQVRCDAVAIKALTIIE